MKKLLVTIVMMAFASVVFAADSANIDLRISGAAQDNRYFFCEPNIGCLSILAAQRGKIYPIFTSFKFHNVYVTNLQNLRVSGQPLPNSCNVTVNPGQTIIVHGQLTHAPNHNTYLARLYCSVK